MSIVDPSPEPHYADSTITLHHGDCLDALRSLPDASVDAVCTDPPYNLSFMAKPWDAYNGQEDAGFAYWLSGLIDGEGHFGIKAHARGTHAPHFALKLRADERGTLERIRRSLGVGTVSDEKREPNPMVKYVIQDKAGCQRLVDLLDKYPLRAKKQHDYWTWREAVCEWTSRPRGNRWSGRADNTRMADLRDRLMTGRAYTDIPWSGHEFQDWCRLWTAECLRVLKPGGHLLAFGGTRTWHRLTCAVEDAGFEVRDSIAWLYGSGFPKSLDVSKAIDKMDAGVERRARNLRFTEWMRSTGVTSRQLDDVTSSFMGGHYLTSREQAAVPTPDMFDLIRPLIHEAIPEWVEALIRERTVESENYKARAVIGERTTGISTGMGSVSVIQDNPDNRDVTVARTAEAEQWQGWGTALKPAFEPIVVARKPLAGTVASNVQAWGTGALNIDGCRICGEDETGWRRDARDEHEATHRGRTGEASADQRYTERGGTNFAPLPGVRGGSPAGRWPANVVLDESQAEALDKQTGTLTSGKMLAGTKPKGERETYGQDAAAGYETQCDTPGDQGGASRFLYVAKAGADERVRVDGIAHPTVKPLSLMRWLVRLVTPPGGTVLEPFAGSGTTVEACLLEGFRCIAIEREADYLPLIRQRINRRRDPVAAVKGAGEDGGLFDLLGEEPA